MSRDREREYEEVSGATERSSGCEGPLGKALLIQTWTDNAGAFTSNYNFVENTNDNENN